MWSLAAGYKQGKFQTFSSKSGRCRWVIAQWKTGRLGEVVATGGSTA